MERDGQADKEGERGSDGMNATELFHSDGKTAGIFYCGTCRVVHRTEAQANSCCAPKACKKCGVEMPDRYQTTCYECRLEALRQREADRFEKATKITEWDGWVYCDGTGKDGFSESLEDLLDSCDEPPEYVWSCKAQRIVNIDVTRILETYDEDGYDGYRNDLVGLPEFEAAVSAFCETNKHVVSYTPDYSIAVLVENVGGGK
jgi:hypothetical protein